MKRLFYIFFACLFSCCALAQENNTSVHVGDTVPLMRTDVHSAAAPSVGIAPAPASALTLHDATAPQDTLHLPPLNGYGQTGIGLYPMNWCGWHNWELHKGLNASLGASVFAMFGDGPWKGAGFTQNVSLMYAVPVTGKLSFAVGGYFNNLSWSHDSYRDAGLNAVLGYKFDDHWEAYLYAQKSLLDKKMPLPLYDACNLGDRIGAMVKYNFNPRFSVHVSVEARKGYDRPCYWY